ncbi:MAG: T9SS type A sorting domain-containing protein [Ignavibacteriae bacterium]|nr:T9SS type A sorting domain-containing protein [Ignavibacteriota bacterium]
MKNFICIILFLFSSISAKNFSLKSLDNQFDYVIITIDKFRNGCEEFKDHKNSHNNFSVLITTKNEILNEFYDSENEQENIRDFISYTNHFWQDPKPKYFLFAADLDSIPNFKFRSVDFIDYNDSSYSDFYYGIDKLGDDSTKISVSVGRISSQDTIQLKNYFSKIITYESNSFYEEWHNKSLFISDDEYGGNDLYDGNIFQSLTRKVADYLPNSITKDFIIPIDTSEFYGNNQTIMEKLNSGVSSVYFCGHANDTIFTHESLFVYTDISKLLNVNKPFFVSFLAGQQFARNNETSIVNELINSQNGALASISPVGAVFAIQNNELIKNIWSSLYSGKSIGEIYITSINEADNFNEKRKMNIFGDPSVTLKYNFPVSISSVDLIQEEFSLLQNYPNPFNPSTKISYTIPDLKAGEILVKLIIYDILGNEIEILVNESQTPGKYSVTFDAKNISTGVYFYSLITNNFIETKKMLLIK